MATGSLGLSCYDSVCSLLWHSALSSDMQMRMFVLHQVLNIVYFDTTTTPGGFLPAGVSCNSNLASATATPADERCALSS